MTNNFGDPTNAAQLYGRGIAHEICHVLNLDHRGDNKDNLDDGVEMKGGEKNIMYPHQGADLVSEDLDLIQLVAARGSPALKK